MVADVATQRLSGLKLKQAWILKGNLEAVLALFPASRKTVCVAKLRSRREAMRGSICGMFVLVVVAGLARPVSGQVNNINSPDFQGLPEVRSNSLHGTTEERLNAVLTRADGSTAGVFEEKRVFLADGQGGVMAAKTLMEKGSAIGATHFVLDDHADGTRAIWTTEDHHAWKQKFPEGVAGRFSCWRIAPSEQTRSWYGIDGMFPEVTCRPAAERYCEPFGAVLSTPEGLLPAGASVAAGTYADCRESLSKPSKQDSERKDEDLGSAKILDFETHGCRVTFKTSEFTIVDEKWVAELGSEGSRKPLVLRSVYEGPYYIGSEKVTTAKTRIETTSFSLEEPDPGSLQPPKDYTIETVEMHEVPCAQPLPPVAPPAQ